MMDYTEPIGASHDWRDTGHELYYPVSDSSVPAATTAPTGRPWANEVSFKKSLVELNEAPKPQPQPKSKSTTKPKSTSSSKPPVPPKYPPRKELLAKAGDHAAQTVLANHFELQVDTKDLYEYEVLDLEGQGSRKRIQALFQRAINAWPHLNNNQDSFATDKRKIIVSWKNLHEGLTDQPEDPGQGVDQEGAIWPAQDITNGTIPIQARLKFVGKVKLKSLIRQINAIRSEAASDLSSVERCLNILISKSFDHEILRLSANKFFVKKARDSLKSNSGAGKRESQSLEIMRGYYYAIKPGMGNLLMNFNVATSAFFRPILVSEFLADNNTFGSETEKLSILRRLRVYVEPNHKEDRYTKFSSRIKSIHDIGDETNANIEDLYFQKRVRNPDGTLSIVDGAQQFESAHIYVTDHLKEGKSTLICSTPWPLTMLFFSFQAQKPRPGSESRQLRHCDGCCLVCSRALADRSIPAVHAACSRLLDRVNGR
jgi:hypothetical protein